MSDTRMCCSQGPRRIHGPPTRSGKDDHDRIEQIHTRHPAPHRRLDQTRHRGSVAPDRSLIRWALARLGEANVPDVVHAVVLTLTGKKKAAKQARKSAEATLRRAERKLRPTGHGKAWLAAGILAAAAAAAARAWQRRQNRAATTEPKTGPAADTAE